MQSNLALYREYRPRTFNDVYGQRHITDVLKKQIETGHIAHAYLFCGPRGTGKTSCAKILSRAVNCMSPVDGEPCGKCEACLSIIRDANIDVIEMDAASNNGVDNIRDIRERIQLSPSNCKYKVYIIDEVHMLTGGAFNALLKTLEEPPAHAIFILATTEPRKLPATILSRCQRFDFHRISTQEIARCLQSICAAENMQFEDNALMLIASYADGAMRDAISILDRLRSAGDTIDIKLVSDVLGGSDTQRLLRVVAPICAYDEKNAVANLLKLLSDGSDCGVLLHEITAVMSDAYAAAYLGIDGGFSRYYENVGFLREAGLCMGKSGLLRGIEVLLSREYDLRMSMQPDIVLISALLRSMSPEADSDLPARVDKIESSMREMAKDPASVRLQPASADKGVSQPQKQKQAEKAGAKPSKKVRHAGWEEIVTSLISESLSYYMAAKKMICESVDENKIVLTEPDDMSIAGEILKDAGFGDIIKKVCREKYGRELELVIEQAKAEEEDDFPWSDVDIID